MIESDNEQLIGASNFNPDEYRMLVQCIKSCIATRNVQQQSVNLGSTFMNNFRSEQRSGVGDSVQARGSIAQQALQYLANMSVYELGSLGMGSIPASMGAVGYSTGNTVPLIGQAGRFGAQGASSLYNGPTATAMGQGARNMASQGYNQASAMAGRFGNMASNLFSRRQGQGGRKRRRTRRHKKR